MEMLNWNNKLKIIAVEKYFGGLKAIDNCSFEVEPKKITALIGLNGAGKSTILNLISGIINPDSGQVFLGDQELTNKSPEFISRLGIIRTFQKTKLFNNLTVKENFSLVLNNKDTDFFFNLFNSNRQTSDQQKRIKEILKLFGLEPFGNKLVRELSYGQRRLIEISRAILTNYNFLIFDEPVAGIAPQLRLKISDLFLKLREKNRTILFVEHDIDFAFKVADVIIVMEKGRVIAQGKPKKIKENKKFLEIYLGKKFEK